MSRPQIVDQVEDVRDELDLLVRDLRLGIRGAGHLDTLEERAQAIAAALVAAFRGDAGRPASVPVRLSRNGRGVWA
ncbi:hypothetical protein ACFQ1E_17430 [Sphingomonas canadensis]|uniref:Uncharacterized protein n=1 Tax=Sphingomonas canadensis TaxID=1219257 RepID=A0ABW3HFR1_9SPHN|nr:hypothetical protein [Sphingomonas canadensis]MCW3837830.1 hypothetical protein [Sphingomonas canadensis]